MSSSLLMIGPMMKSSHEKEKRYMDGGIKRRPAAA